MQSVTDFFVDPLVWPVVVYLAAYGFVWMIACGLGQFLKSRVSIERAAALAWGIAFVTHILGGTFFIIWLWDRAYNRFSDGLYTFLYVCIYIVVMIVDIILLFSALTKGERKKNVNVPNQKSMNKSINPKKKS